MAEGQGSLLVLQSCDDAWQGRAATIGAGVCIGRRSGEAVDLVIDDRLLSRRHATILADEGGYELRDLDSRNGSFVDGQRVERSRLFDGAIVRLGVTVFQLVRGEAVAAAVPEEGAMDGALVGCSLALRRALEAIDAAASRSGPVLVAGEHGSGKIDAARRVHRRTPSEARPFVVVDAASRDAARRMFEDGEAAGGTLVVDRIEELDGALQQRLAASIERGLAGPPARVVATTEVDLDVLVEDGAFSGALYQALAPNLVELPSLRQRRADVAMLARHFWRERSPKQRLELSATCLEKLLLYDWPMNVRELRRLVHHLTVAEGDRMLLRSAHLPPEIRQRVRGQKTIDQLRASAYVVDAIPDRAGLAALLAQHGGDVGAVARLVQRDKRHVYRWLKRHDLRVSEFR